MKFMISTGLTLTSKREFWTAITPGCVYTKIASSLKIAVSHCRSYESL